MSVVRKLRVAACNLKKSTIEQDGWSINACG